MPRTQPWLASATALLLACACLPACCDAKYPVKKHIFTFLPGYGGISLLSDVFYPEPGSRGNSTFPVVIFPNSWGVPEFEYIVLLEQWAAQGYIAIEYATRGWYLSGGEINTAGPLDRADGSQIIDWVFNNSAALGFDGVNVGFGGISYGAGISLLMAGYDARVKTAVAMSGWANLSANLYNQQSTELHTIDMLIGAANKTGRPSPALMAMYRDLINHRNISGAIAFADDRGAIKYIDQINARAVPLLLSNNYLDRIFYPNLMSDDFFNALTGPKQVLGNCGGHASAEIPGILGLKNHVWTRALEWFDYWLKGIANGVMGKPQATFQLEGDIFTSNFQYFSTWPAPPSELSWSTFVLTPRGNAPTGGLVPQDGARPAGAVRPSSPPRGHDDTIYFVKPAPVQDPYDDGSAADWGVFPSFNVTGLDRQHAIVYLSDPLAVGVRVCGSPQATLAIRADSASWQLYGYLFDVAADGTTGAILSSTQITRWGDSPSDAAVNVTLAFHTMCRDFEAWDSVGLGFVLYSDSYSPANTSSALGVRVDTAAGGCTLTLPIVV